MCRKVYTSGLLDKAWRCAMGGKDGGLHGLDRIREGLSSDCSLVSAPSEV